MVKSIYSAILAAVLLWVASLLPTRSAQAGFYADLFGEGAYLMPSVTAGATAPMIIPYGGGVSLGWFFGTFGFGATGDVEYLPQLSSVTAAVGNLRGINANYVSPFLALDFGLFDFRVYPIFFGQYFLLTAAADGSSVNYKDPLGGRADINFALGKYFAIGAHFMYEAYGTQTVSATGSTSLATRQVIWQAGAQLSFRPFGSTGDQK